MAAGMAMDEATGAAFLYGGFDDEGFRQDMHYYDVTKFSWKEVKTNQKKEDVPGKRVHVRLVCASRYLVLFGGSCPASDYSDDLFVMDTKASPFQWTGVTFPPPDEDGVAVPRPKGRYGHAMCALNDFVVVFGGLGEGEKYLNDLWIIDCRDFDAGQVSWEYVKPGGSYWPKGRDSHAMCAVGNELVLFGGYDGVSSKVVPTGELEVYSFEIKEWRCVATCGEAPNAGNNCAMHALGTTGKIIAISGSNGGIFNLISILGEERERTKKDDGRQRRNETAPAHSLTLVERKIVLFVLFDSSPPRLHRHPQAVVRRYPRLEG